MSEYIIYTTRIGGNGSTYRDQFKCKKYNIEHGYIDFWNLELNKRHLISIYKMDSIMIESVDDKNTKEEKGVEIKCTT
jgi:hypothetical protein